MAWNPDQYLKFAAPRLRPALDLIAALPSLQPRRVVDLGCGTGHITRLLARRWPAAQVSGVDSSAEMLAKAAADPGPIAWQQAELGVWRAAQPLDLIFSNAALHWLPAHRDLFPALFAQLAPGGVLAAQMPRNFDAPSHTLIAETVAGGAWRARLEPLLRPAPVAPPTFYFELLAPLASGVDIWETEYLQVLDGVDAVFEWTKGTWLRPFLDALDDPVERAAFQAAHARRLRAAYPARADGRTLFPFRRLFMVATAG